MADWSLFETREMRRIMTRSTRGNLLAVIAEVSAALPEALELPRLHDSDTEGLSLGERLTDSSRVLELTVKALRSLIYENDIQKARSLTEKALADDPSYAVGHLMLGQILVLLM